MNKADMRTLLAETRDRAIEYIERIGERPVFPGASSLAGLDVFDEPLPDGPTRPMEVIDLLHRFGSPATVATTGGRYFGFVSGGVLPAALAANWMAGTWDQNAGFWAMSPVSSRLEEVVSRWLLELLDLPEDTVFGYVTGSTMAAFSALAAARSAICSRHGHDIVRAGLRNAPPIRVVANSQIHPSNIRALAYLGIGRDEIEWVDVDAMGQVSASGLPPLDDRTIVLLQAGNVNTGGFDPFHDVADLAATSGAWIHVDGAFGMWARVSPSKRALAAGIERADSWNLDGHKWLNVPMDSGVFGCRHPRAVLDAFGIDAPYLVRSERREPNYFTPELGRRSRGVELWAALKSLGRRGVVDMIERSCEFAERFEKRLGSLGYEILNDVCLNQVLFALEDDGRTRRALEHVQASDRTWIGPTSWQGRLAMRISCCSWIMDDEDLDVTVNVLAVARDNS